MHDGTAETHGGSDPATATKRRVREEVRASRAAMSAADRLAASSGLAERLIALVRDRGAASFTCYAPVRGEPDTTPLLDWAVRQGVEVLLPSSLEGRRIAWARYTGEPLGGGRHGIPEPSGERLPVEAAASADLLLVPACSVDERGIRLGWGLGYYDRCFEALELAGRRPPSYAVLFDSDLRAELPREPHDIPVDGAVTPSRTIRFSASR